MLFFRCLDRNVAKAGPGVKGRDGAMIFTDGLSAYPVFVESLSTFYQTDIIAFYFVDDQLF